MREGHGMEGKDGGGIVEFKPRGGHFPFAARFLVTTGYILVLDMCMLSSQK